MSVLFSVVFWLFGDGLLVVTFITSLESINCSLIWSKFAVSGGVELIDCSEVRVLTFSVSSLGTFGFISGGKCVELDWSGVSGELG